MSDEPSNVAAKFLFEEGDVEAGFAEAAVVVEREFTFATVHQGYIENHNALALWHGDGELTVWCSSQGHFTIRAEVADILDVPISKVKVIPTEIGGGFGGKTTCYLEPLAAALGRKAGRPVKMTMGRADILKATGPTPGGYIRVKMGADSDGKITAAEAYMAFEAGGIPRVGRGRRLHVRVRALQRREREDRGRRRGREPAQDARLPRTGAPRRRSSPARRWWTRFASSSESTCLTFAR